MKQNFVRLSIRAKTVSLRTLALVMGLVMLLSAVGVGSTLSAFALTNDGSGDQAASLSAAADLGTGIADTATQLKPTLPAYANASLRGDKEDLADTGYTLNEIKYLKLKKDGGSEVSYDINSGNVSVNITTTGTYYFYIEMNNTDKLTNTGSISNSISNWQLDTKTSATNSCTLNVSTTGTYVFNFSISSDKVKMAVTFPSGGSSGEGTYVLTGDKAITGTSGWKNTTTNNTANQLQYKSATKLYKITKTVSDTTHTFNFRIVPNGTWDKTWGYNRANEVDNANIATWSEGSDNNIQMKLSKSAVIEIRLDDSKTDTSAVTVIVTPTTSTVNAAVTPAGSGTATVGGQSSATVAYGGNVTVSATPGADYLFSKWTSTNGKVSFASTTNASTTATVIGDDTVTANFVNKSYTVSKGTGTGFTITTPTSNQSKQWGTSVSVAAKTSSDLYYIDYLYYRNNDEGDEVVIDGGAAADKGTATTLSGTFDMPKNNVTVYAHVHLKPSFTINYDVSTDSDSAGHGYVTGGLQNGTSTTQIKYTVASGSNVLQNQKINLGARPASGYYFAGWYPNPDGSGTLINAAQDVTLTMDAAKNYYAVFKPLSVSSGIRLLIYSTS